MKNRLIKAKNSIKEIRWPSKKEVLSDTVITVLTTAILSSLISVWVLGIETVVNFVISLFN